MTLKIRLDLDDFKKLVAGGEISMEFPSSEKNLKIILAEIGYLEMIKVVTDAASKI